MFGAVVRELRWRKLAWTLCTGGTALLAGCEESALFRMQTKPANPPGMITVSAPPRLVPSQQHGFQLVGHETLPESATLDVSSKVLPICLDTVMRLAEEQNRQIALARERLSESETEQQLAASAWLPAVYAGIGYFRHEGGIQDQDGTLVRSSTGALFPGVEIRSELDVKDATFKRVNACRKRWQQQGELTKVTNETLLEAGTTYMDLLAARRGETVGHEIGKHQDELLKRAEKLNTDGSLKFMVEGLKAEEAGRRQVMAKLRQQGDAAGMKLAYLLGLPHDVKLVPVDRSFSPIDLVDANPPADALIDRAVTNGPGIREMEGLLDTIQGGIAELDGPKKFIPVVSVNAVEGGFGAGPGARLDWANRFDLGIQARWNLTEYVTAREKRQLARSKLAQAQLSFEDLKGKLTLGVQEGREAILSGQQQIIAAGEMVKHANENYRLSNLRLTENAPGASIAEVVQAIRILEMAHVNYLQSIRDYNKAQIRMTLLLGPRACIGPK